MMPPLSSNAQAILLLTAPLIIGRALVQPDLLTPTEYKRLAQRLHEIEREPADLLSSKSDECFSACELVTDTNRLRGLLGRGVQLSQAVDRWQTRAIWVLSRADAAYPHRLKERLRTHAPPIIYGCGELDLLNDGGLAVVGSRHVDDVLFDYTMSVGQLAARANKTVISGGAKGIDQAAMRGALEAGGKVCGVLADSLEKQAMARDHRDMLLDGQLVLISPYDPNAGFNVGHAMQRNKIVYALADAALVVNSDVDKGGTWAGAIEQLEKFKFGPVFVRSTGEPSKGLEKLRTKGAYAWPDPNSTDEFENILSAHLEAPWQDGLPLAVENAPMTLFHKNIVSAEHTTSSESGAKTSAMARDVTIDQRDLSLSKKSELTSELDSQTNTSDKTPAETLFAVAQNSIECLLNKPMKHVEVAQALQVEPKQAKDWLDRLVEAGVLEMKSKPIVYMRKQEQLFG